MLLEYVERPPNQHNCDVVERGFNTVLDECRLEMVRATVAMSTVLKHSFDEELRLLRPLKSDCCVDESQREAKGDIEKRAFLAINGRIALVRVAIGGPHRYEQGVESRIEAAANGVGQCVGAKALVIEEDKRVQELLHQSRLATMKAGKGCTQYLIR